jgi:ubiquitin-protein ligase
MARSKLDKRIQAEIDGLKLISINRVLPIIFILDEASLDKEETVNTGELKERLVIGRIFPNSEIFKEGAFQIEIKLPLGYPLDPPKVRFLTPIYHPNVSEQGR